MKRRVWWGCGYSFLVCQLLSSGTFGSTWLSQHSNLGLVASAGQIVAYINYAMVLAMAIVGPRFLFPINDRRMVLAFGTAGAVAGNLLCGLAGCLLVPLWLYPLGVWGVSVGAAFLYLGWGEYHCAIGPRSACLSIAFSLVAGVALYALLCFVAEHSLAAATALLAVFMPVCLLFMVFGWKGLDASSQESGLAFRKAKPSMSLRLYLTTVTTFGLALGVLTGLARSQDVTTSFHMWVAAICFACALVTLIVVRPECFNRMGFVQLVSPVLIICSLLIPLFWRSNFAFACVLVCAVYMNANMFYQIAYIDVSQIRKAALLLLVVCGAGTYVAGVAAGESLCAIMWRLGFFSFEVIYMLALVVAGFAFSVSLRCMRNGDTRTFGGFRERGSGAVNVEERCNHAAERASLTPREREILKELACGHTAQEIAEKMVVSLATIRTHARNIYRKIDVHSQTELINKVVHGGGGDGH